MWRGNDDKSHNVKAPKVCNVSENVDESFKIINYEEGEGTIDEISHCASESSSRQTTVEPKHAVPFISIKRGLKPRHINLIGIGGTIGTALFVQIASVLNKGGPGSLFISFSTWCVPIVFLTLTTSEMVTYFPLASPFTRLAGRCVDDALEVASSWNFFILQATLVPFEITGVTYIIEYWRTDFTPAAVIVPQLALYTLINSVLPVKWYGEVEFWLSITKLLLLIGLLLFTFITMVGGNPLHDVYGFRYWRDPGSFAEYKFDGSLGRFLGYASCLSQASYTVAGPDYVSMTAGEAVNPRKVLPKAYKGVMWRLTVCFVLGTLAMGIVCAYNDPVLVHALNGGSTSAVASPYVIAMNRLNIPVLPHIINVALILSAFSSGNSYFYCATRTLHGMAVAGHAPRIFCKCLPNGAPIVASLVVIAFGMLSFLQMSGSSSEVLNWIVSLGTPAELLNYCLMSLTYLRFFYACKKQGFSRNCLPYVSPFQPWLAYTSFVATFAMTWLAGWSVFVTGNWSWTTFVLSYVIIPFDIAVYVLWKLWKKTKIKRLEEIDLYGGLEEVTEHEQKLDECPPRGIFDRVINILVG